MANVCSACARLGGDLSSVLGLLDHPGAVTQGAVTQGAVTRALGAADVAEVGWAIGRMALSVHGGRAVSPMRAQLARVAAEVWRRAAELAPELGWRECGGLEFSLRAVPPALRSAVTELRGRRRRDGGGERRKGMATAAAEEGEEAEEGEAEALAAYEAAGGALLPLLDTSARASLAGVASGRAAWRQHRWARSLPLRPPPRGAACAVAATCCSPSAAPRADSGRR